MALQWFLRAATSVQIIAHAVDTSESVHEPTKLKHLQMAHCGDAEKDKQCMTKKNKALSYREGFHMPLHYPRYKREDYMSMEERRVDMLLREYGLAFDGSLDEKRAYAIGTFLWPTVNG